MRRILLGLSFYALMLGYAAWAALMSAVLAARHRPMSERWHRVSRIQGRGARRMLHLLGWEVEAAWADPAWQIPADAPVLIAANHIGALDPWIVASVFDCSFVGKSEIARWPIIGLVGRAAGLILAHRQQKMKTAGMVASVRERMACGVPVALFPEGTTSDGQGLLPFKTGGFAALAESGGAASSTSISRDVSTGSSGGVVLPVHFHITHVDGREATDEEKVRLTWHGGEELWPYLWRVARHKLRWGVRVGAPISAAGHTRKFLAAKAERAVDVLRERSRAGSVTPLPAEQQNPPWKQP